METAPIFSLFTYSPTNSAYSKLLEGSASEISRIITACWIVISVGHTFPLPSLFGMMIATENGF